MRSAIREIASYTQGHDAQSFLGNRQLVRSVERCFEILGEAARNIPRAVQERHAVVPWKRITGLRNILAHDYDSSRDMVLWVTIERDLPELMSILETMEIE
ncbi:MAG TPA: DUF86 domain-containing protein [Alphaproteobacteria bacterium]|nr:DUF86 domain-containing protein [Alphaproteobacteria bacterium]